MPASEAALMGSIRACLSVAAMQIADGLLGNYGVQDRALQRGVKLGRAVGAEVDAEFLGLGAGAFFHRDIEAVTLDAVDQGAP